MSLFHWPTTHRAFVQGRTPLQGPIAPQTGHKHRSLLPQQPKLRTHGGLRAHLEHDRRRNTRDVQVNRRYGALCVLRDAALVGRARRGEAQRIERQLAALIAAIVRNIWQHRTRLLIGPSVRQQPPRFSSITKTEAWHDFRFRAEDFPRLLRALRIPRRVVLRNGSTFHGETALLLLRRMR